MNRKIVLSAAIIFILLIGLVAFISYTSLNGAEEKPFYVGVTYGGNTIAGAKQIIDKVKDYTNLFVLQSGSLIQQVNAVNEIGDYAVDAGLNYMVYFGSGGAGTMKRWLDSYDGRWNSRFSGVYFGDEPGGKMLDGYMQLNDQKTGSAISKYADGVQGENPFAFYYRNGTINVPAAASSAANTVTTYYPNGTITVTTYQDTGNVIEPTRPSQTVVVDAADVDYSYEELWNTRPLQSYDETAERFINKLNSTINQPKTDSPQFNFNFLTADYALYWFDYLGGYNTVLAELGWNNTVAQEIGLVRGAANLQGKSWGTILTWKYMQAPYLASGTEMFDQMRTSYECGAKYVIIFNYAEDRTGPYGTLQEEHFQALERFWNEVVQNPSVVHGGVKAEAALVLPKNYGWGMRNPNDIIWGLWSTNSTSEQIWTQLQNKIVQYGTRLDIVYEDPAYPVAGRYSNIYYWNQTA
jgi:hypothetical protein